MTNLVSTAQRVHERMGEARRLSGLTTRQIAQEVGVSQTTVSNWENGKGEPSITQFVLWCQATKQPVENMLDGLSFGVVRPKGLEPLTFWMVAVYRWIKRHRTDAAFWSIVRQLEIDTVSTFPVEVAR